MLASDYSASVRISLPDYSASVRISLRAFPRISPRPHFPPSAFPAFPVRISPHERNWPSEHSHGAYDVLIGEWGW